RANDFERRTEEGQLKGKLGYMSPEQVTGQAIDSRSDLFTLGIVMAELLVARPLFGIGNELDVLMRIRDADLSTFERYGARLPSELRDVVRKALAQKPDDRFSNATEFAEAIEDFLRQSRTPTGAHRLVAWLHHASLIPSTKSSDSALAIGRTRHSTPRAFAAVVPIKNVTPSVPTVPMKPPMGAETVVPSDYRVVSGQQSWGPVSYAKMVELFATGRAQTDSLVARGAGPFRPARDIPELARLLLSAALSAPPEAPEHALERWELDRASHVHKLFSIVSSKQTGLLIAAQGNRMKRFFLSEGAFTFATSTDKAELLGQQLIARGQAMQMEVDMALALCPRYGGRLGDALVGLGVLRPVELFRALVAQIHDRLVDLVSWRSGSLQFIRGVRAEEEAILHGVAPVETLAQGVINGYDQEELSQILRPYMQSEIRSAPPGEWTASALRLKHKHLHIIEKVSKPTVLGTLIDQTLTSDTTTKDDVLRAVFIGLSAGLLLATGWPPTPRLPSIPTKKMF
ncbi:MAG TPA: hypothetical protein PK710_21900, partial [Polyangiaceae bacterium]|nr:hypothetical protein [Polyangiaceae bacterium]